MVVSVVLLAIVAVAAIVAFAWTRARLTSQSRETAAVNERLAGSETQLAAANDALATASQEKTAAEERATAAEEASTRSTEQAQLAEQRAEAAEQARHEAQDAADSAAEAQRAAEERAAASERRASELAAVGAEPGGGVDAEVLWSLERARSERTWRLAVAPALDAESIFTSTADPLIEALHVELDAAREEVGAIIELDAQLAGALTPAGSLLTLRAAQELLASVVRRAEETTLLVRTDGADVVVGVRAVDDEGGPVTPAALPLPPSFDIEATDEGVRVRNAVAEPET